MIRNGNIRIFFFFDLTRWKSFHFLASLLFDSFRFSSWISILPDFFLSVWAWNSVRFFGRKGSRFAKSILRGASSGLIFSLVWDSIVHLYYKCNVIQAKNLNVAFICALTHTHVRAHKNTFGNRRPCAQQPNTNAD